MKVKKGGNCKEAHRSHSIPLPSEGPRDCLQRRPSRTDFKELRLQLSRGAVWRAVYAIAEKLKSCQMMISYRERRKIYLYIRRSEQTRQTRVNGRRGDVCSATA